MMDLLLEFVYLFKSKRAICGKHDAGRKDS